MKVMKHLLSFGKLLTHMLHDKSFDCDFSVTEFDWLTFFLSSISNLQISQHHCRCNFCTLKTLFVTCGLAECW